MKDSNRVNLNVEGGSAAFVLFVVFLVLKLTNAIDWSWWWVTAPLWAPVALVLLLVILGGALVAGMLLLIVAIKAVFGKRR
jgi:uncharacterized integral membrane protein